MSLREEISKSLEAPVPIINKYRKLVDQKYMDAAEGCNRCISCKLHHAEYNKGLRWGRLCPAGSYFNFDSHFALGRLNMIVGLIRGEYGWTDGLIHSLYCCCGCGACNTICDFMQELNPAGTELTMEKPLRPLDVIEEFKRVGVVEGVGPPTRLKSTAESVERVGNPFNEPQRRRMAWWPKDVKFPPAKAKLMFFVGCASSYRQQEIARSTVGILNKLGVEFGVTPDEVCCGSHLFRSGIRETGVKTLRKAIEAMIKAEAEVVFTGDAEVYRVLKSDAPENELEVPFEVIHTMDILKEREEELRVLLKRKWKEKVTYHDPCNLGRQMGYYEIPREILSMVPGLELVELHRNRKWSWCCGAGGGVNLDFPDQARWVAVERLWEARDVEANTIATLCPWCRWNFISAMPSVSRWLNVKVNDITEILWKSME